MNINETTNNQWVDSHLPDPRFPTDPEFVLIEALSQQYGIDPAKILELALVRPGTCLRSDGNPWVDHGSEDESLYFHEPTLQTAITAKTI